MTDELFMRQWNAGHDRLSADIDRALVRLRRVFRRARPAPPMIGRAYAESDQMDSSLRKATGYFLGVLAAVSTTTTLLVVVALLTAPFPADGRAASAEIVTPSESYAA